MNRRESLKPLLNKKVTVTAYIKEVQYKSSIDLNDKSKRNVCVLLKPVSVDGVEINHLWLYQKNKYYENFHSLKGECVKFKANVVSYVKNKNGIYSEDYGIEPISKVMPKTIYDRQVKKL